MREYKFTWLRRSSKVTKHRSTSKSRVKPVENKIQIENVLKISKQESDSPSIKSLESQANFLRDSYKPPISGSASDIKLLIHQTTLDSLPYPHIIPSLPESNENMWIRQDIQVNDYLAEVYTKEYIVDLKGVNQKFKDVANPLQGRHLYNLVKENKYTFTLEIGLAMGASAVWIAQAHEDNGLKGLHVAIDPNQTEQYNNIGRLLVQRSGLDSYLSILEMPSYRGLPKLLDEVVTGLRKRFQLIYIDGWHTFDYTLIDFFYADLLLDVHGVIVLDDIKHKPVSKFLNYITANYKNYQIVSKTPVYDEHDPKVSSQATFVKLGEDERAWNYHVDF